MFDVGAYTFRAKGIWGIRAGHRILSSQSNGCLYLLHCLSIAVLQHSNTEKPRSIGRDVVQTHPMLSALVRVSLYSKTTNIAYQHPNRCGRSASKGAHVNDPCRLSCYHRTVLQVISSNTTSCTISKVSQGVGRGWPGPPPLYPLSGFQCGLIKYASVSRRPQGAMTNKRSSLSLYLFVNLSVYLYLYFYTSITLSRSPSTPLPFFISSSPCLPLVLSPMKLAWPQRPGPLSGRLVSSLGMCGLSRWKP